MADKITRRITIEINGKQVEKNIKNVRKEYWRLNKQINEMTVGSEEYNKTAAEMKKLDGIYREHRGNLKSIDDSQEGMIGSLKSYIGVAAAAFSTDMIIQYGVKLFNLGANLDLIAQKAEIVFAQSLPEINRAASKNAAIMGLTESQYVKAATAIGDLLVPMGFQRDRAAEISSELTNLSGALAEWSSGKYNAVQVSEILSKALLGEREQLKSLGISIKEADVKARVAAKGLDNLTGKSLEQARAAATLELITEKSVDAQTSFIENTDTLTRKQSEMNAVMQTAQENLAKILIPVFEDLVNAAADLTTSLTDIGINLGDIKDQSDAVVETYKNQVSQVDSLEESLVPLLKRYEELQDPSTKEEQEELNGVIKEIGKITPGAVTAVNKYGDALSINADKAREFLKIERQRLQFINRDAIATLEENIANTKSLINNYKDGIENTSEWRKELMDMSGATEHAMEKISELSDTLPGMRAQLAFLRGEDIEIPDGEDNGDGSSPPKPPPTTPTEEDEGDGLADYNKEVDKLIAKSKDLEKAIDAFTHKRDIAAMDERKQAIQKLSDTYDNEIDDMKAVANKLQEAIVEADRNGTREQQAALRQRYTILKSDIKELESEKHEEVQSLKEQYANEDMEKEIKRLEEEQLLRAEQKAKRIEEFRTTQEELREIMEGESEATLEQAYIALDEYYQELLTQADLGYGKQMQLLVAYLNKKDAIEKKYRKNSLHNKSKEVSEKLEVVGQAFGSLGDAVGSAMDIAGEKSKEFVALQKGLAIAQIAINTANAISNIVTAITATSIDPFTLAARIAIGVATITANIAKAKSLIEGTEIPQAYKGGYYEVTGEDDRNKYRAKYTEDTSSRYLSTPTLLAGERGTEYIINNDMLQQPPVARFVEMLEATGGRGMPQYAEGGFTRRGNNPDSVKASQDGTDKNITSGSSNDVRLIAVMEALIRKLDQPSIAILTDNTLVDMKERQKELSEASGNAI